MHRRHLIACFTVLSSALALVMACTGGPGGLGEFGDDGTNSQSQTTTSSSGASSSGRSSTSTSTSTSSGISSTSSGSTTSTSSGSTTSTTSSGSSSGGFDAGQRYTCGTTTCAANQYCETTCCPPGPSCLPYYPDDGGPSGCPSGYTYTGSGFTCTSDGGLQCTKNTCTVQSYCTTLPSSTVNGGTCGPRSGDPRYYDCTCN